jgi:UDP-GlcNAc:undecaprenyl-phosphate/decaprenyl-phosphate GlcNAc-1-phosphate transferase
LLVLGLPITDVVWLIVRRVSAGRMPMRGGDRQHLPQRLHAAGLSQRQIVLGFYALCAAFGIAAISLSSEQKLLAFGALAVVMAAILFALARADQEGRPGSAQ